MILGSGNDILDVRRIKRILNKYDEKFKKRCFTEIEIEKSEKRINKYNSYAKRYAAKEACAKALGTGLSKGVFWKDISVQNNKLGKPLIKLSGNALKRLKKLSNTKCSIEVSLSDEKNYAIATVIIFENNEVH